MEGRASARALRKSQAKKSKFSPLRNSTDYVILVTPVVSLPLIQSSQSSARSHHDSSGSHLIPTNCYPGGYQGVIFTVRLSRRLVRAPIAITMRTARALIVTDSSPIPVDIRGVIFTVRLSRRLVRAQIAITTRTERALIMTDSSPIPGLSDLI